MSSKLNWLLSNITPGNLALQSWLSAHGISPQLTRKYTQSHWLTKLRTGVYLRPGRSPQWQDAVHCLIEQSNIPVRIAGLTSLNLQGKSQYLTILEPSIWLALPPDASLPTWFREFSHDANGNSENKNPQWEPIKIGKITSIAENDIIEIQTGGLILPASKQELAIYEILEAVPKLISFEHAAELFQGLINLSPRKIQSLLERSNSIKTNRLFLFLAVYYQMPWLSRLNDAEINLGSGKRQIVKGGKLDKTYQITVPEKFIAHG
jgi:predicted HTH domain antitoxin